MRLSDLVLQIRWTPRCFVEDVIIPQLVLLSACQQWICGIGTMEQYNVKIHLFAFWYDEKINTALIQYLWLKYNTTTSSWLAQLGTKTTNSGEQPARDWWTITKSADVTSQRVFSPVKGILVF